MPFGLLLHKYFRYCSIDSCTECIWFPILNTCTYWAETVLKLLDFFLSHFSSLLQILPFLVNEMRTLTLSIQHFFCMVTSSLPLWDLNYTVHQKWITIQNLQLWHKFIQFKKQRLNFQFYCWHPWFLAWCFILLQNILQKADKETYFWDTIMPSF